MAKLEEITLTDEEQQMIEAFIKAHPEASQETAVKFNVGRKFVRERVEECYASYQNTIREHHFEYVTVSDVLDELRTGKLYIPGSRDKQGAALFVINAGKHIPGQFPPESTLKLAFYLGEVLTSSPKTSKVGVTIISNMEGMEWANFDNQFQRTVINFFQENIPARVKSILLYKCPWWVSMMVRMVSPFLKQKIRERIHIVNEGGLEQYIDRERLPKGLGGTYEYDHQAFIEREMGRVPTAGVFKSTVTEHEAENQQVTVEIQKLPPGTELLVTTDVARELEVEREQILAELDARIQTIQQSIKEHTVPTDITRLLRSKAARLSLDLDAIPMMGPSILHMQSPRNDFEGVSPLAERASEDYRKEKIEERIAKSICKDRKSYLIKQGLLAEDDKESENSFTPTGEAVDQSVPVVPKLKTHFSAVVEVFKPIIPDYEEDGDIPTEEGPEPELGQVKRPLEDDEELSSVPLTPRRKPRESRLVSPDDSLEERHKQRTATYSVENVQVDLDGEEPEVPNQTEIPHEPGAMHGPKVSPKVPPKDGAPKRRTRKVDEGKQRNRTAIYSNVPQDLLDVTKAEGDDATTESGEKGDRKSRRTAFINM